MNDSPFPSHNPAPSDAFERKVLASLEEQPRVAVPSDFAARVSARAAALPRRTRAPRARYARSVAMLLSALLVAALFVLAPHAQPSFASVGFDLEMSAIAVLSCLVYWLTQVRKESL